MIIFRYDKTFEGLLTALFDAYFRRTFPDRLLAPGEPGPLFVTKSHTVTTQADKSARVWAGLEKKLEKYVCNMMMSVWLSEEPGCDELLFRFMRKAFDSPRPITGDMGDADMLAITQLAKKVAHEGERVRQFTRLQKGGDGTYFGAVAPKYNALPLAIGYFKDRFADQRWLLYDVKRRYGYYYDLKKAVEVTLEDDAHLLDGRLGDELMAADEKLFQQMWKDYFKSITIKERINPKLHRQNMPRRFWKYLTEKQE